ANHSNVNWMVEAALDRAPRLAETRRLEERSQQLQQGEPASLKALAWWSQLREVARNGHEPLLRDDSFERVLRQLALRGTAAEKAAALSAWFELEPSKYIFLGLQGRILLGPDLARLPQTTRRQLLI